MSESKIISTKTHGILDYLLAAILLIWPRWRSYDPTLTLWLTIVAVGIIVISLVTAYEFSLYKLIPMPTHLVFDVVVGFMIILLPYLLGTGTTVPLAALGVGAIVVAVLSQTHPSPGHQPIPD